MGALKNQAIRRKMVLHVQSSERNSLCPAVCKMSKQTFCAANNDRERFKKTTTPTETSVMNSSDKQRR